MKTTDIFCPFSEYFKVTTCENIVVVFLAKMTPNFVKVNHSCKNVKPHNWNWTPATKCQQCDRNVLVNCALTVFAA